MTTTGRFRHWSRLAVHLGNNPISLVGAALTTAAGVTLVWFWLLELTSQRPVHPYLGILLFMILPAVFAFGLALIPLGLVRRRRRLRMEGKLPTEYPRVDFQAPIVRNALLLLGGVTVVNVAIMGTATYKGVEYLDSTQFCGLTCHTVMTPEYAAFVDSPHSRVGCVQCHIGPGAGWFVKSKLSGVRQVFAVALGTYSRPIPSPVHELRPARETCEQCHWPQKFTGDKLLIKKKYADDEANTLSYTVLALKVGGRNGQRAAGIHGAHLDAKARITYVTTDGRREVIPRVTYRDDKGEMVEYVSEDAKVTPEQLAKGETRDMDCIDCHNRPTHAFELPEQGVDRAITEGRISRELPFVRKKGIELLKVEYPDHKTAQSRISTALNDYYREKLSRAPPHPSHPGRGGRGRSLRRLRAQCLPRHAGDLGHPPQPPRPRRLAGVLPLPRREPQGQGRAHHHPGLRGLPYPGRPGRKGPRDPQTAGPALDRWPDDWIIGFIDPTPGDPRLSQPGNQGRGVEMRPTRVGRLILWGGLAIAAGLFTQPQVRAQAAALSVDNQGGRHQGGPPGHEHLLHLPRGRLHARTSRRATMRVSRTPARTATRAPPSTPRPCRRATDNPPTPPSRSSARGRSTTPA